MKRKNIEVGNCPICGEETRLRYILGKRKSFVCKECRPTICI